MEKQIKITNIERIDMNPIDGSSVVRYSATVNNKTIRYSTDANRQNHLTIAEWEETVKSIYQ